MTNYHKLPRILCGLLLSLAFNCQAQSQITDLDPSLKLHFDFDEDFSDGRVVDVSGNGNDGWQFNSTNWITATNGVFGSAAAQFTYVGFMSNDAPHVYPLSQYIGVTNLTGISILTNGTISFWARFDSNVDTAILLLDSGYNAIYAGSPSLASNSWTLGRDFAPNLSFWVYPGGGGGEQWVSWPDDTIGRDNLGTTQFHLYTLAFNCPSRWAIAYYDGQPYQTNMVWVPWIRVYGCPSIQWLCVGAMAHDGTPFWGDDKYPNAGYFAGKLDDLRIYNRPLSAGEVQALYQGAGSRAQCRHVTAQPGGSNSMLLSWDTLSNTFYQVEYLSNLAAGNWSRLGPAVLGDGGTNRMVDSIQGQFMRFYRVLPLP